MPHKKYASALALIICLLVVLGFQSEFQITPVKLPKIKYFPPVVQNDGLLSKEGIELGKYLFYDTLLSRDYNISCATCHQQEYAFSNSPLKYSVGSAQTPMSRNTPGLFNLAWYPAFFWDGRVDNLVDQVFFPVSAHDEMNLTWNEAETRVSNSPFYAQLFKRAFGDKPIDSNLIAMAIAQFELTLISHNSKYDSVLRGQTYFSADEYEGYVIANDQSMGDCLHCHTTDANGLGTTGKLSNNGLDDVRDVNQFKDIGLGEHSGKSTDFGHFKIPSIRNVGLTAPYMHDGRFQTLEEVVKFYSSEVKNNVTIDSKMQFAHRGGVQLDDEQQRKLVLFLHTLSDSSFIRNSNFSSPFP